MLLGIVLVGVEQAPDTPVVAVQQFALGVENEGMMVPVGASLIAVPDREPGAAQGGAGDQTMAARIDDVGVRRINGQGVVVIARGSQVIDSW